MNDRRSFVLSRRGLLALFGSAAAAPLVHRTIAAPRPQASETLLPDRRDQPFDSDWRFRRGDGDGLQGATFDDSRWRRLDLPHDWSIEDLPDSDLELNAVLRDIDTAPVWQPVTKTPRQIGPFAAEANDHMLTSASAGGGATAFTVGGVGWYRKRFRLPPLAQDARVEIEFDGVYMNAQVWLNGVMLGERPDGYSPFGFDLKPHLDASGENLLAVRVANLGRNSRWYSGSGIYRHVRLNITRTPDFERWGLVVRTQSISSAEATVSVVTRIRGPVAGAMLTTRIRDPAGQVVAEDCRPAAAETNADLNLAKPCLWSPERPELYTVECLLDLADKRLDRMTAPLGVRKVEVDALQGLRINGKPYKLRGGCVHHDNGLLGAAAIDRAEQRKVELLKARGFNAIRTAHNPPSPAMLDACDQLGMLVMEEAFDAWKAPKNPDDYATYFEGWWRQDLAAMVRRDGNHPSVIIWSIGNEIPEKVAPDGVATAKMLADELRRLDPTRPVTEAINGPNGPDAIGPKGKPDQATTQFLDIAGYNYKISSYEPDHVRFPDRIMVGTESFPRDVDRVWRLTERSPYLIGDFVWSAIDYLGEAGIGRTNLSGDRSSDDYPWFGAFCGDIDLIGEQKPQSLARDVVWGISPIEIAVQRPMAEGRAEQPFLWGWRDELQSWTWPGAEGKSLRVSVYTRGDRVRLELNGRVIADQLVTDADKSLVQIAAPYAPGRLVATAYRADRPIGRRALETAGPAAALRLRVDRPRLTAQRDDLAYATIEIVDAAGRLVPDAVHVLRASVSGVAELAAFGNANPRGVASFRQPVAKSWHGRALAVLRPIGDAGDATVRIDADGLVGAQEGLILRKVAS